jgi:hypothetical protein
MMDFAWKALKIASLFNGKPPLISRETAASSKAVNNYDGRKIVKRFNFNYLPISESIKQTAEFLKNEMQNI